MSGQIPIDSRAYLYIRTYAIQNVLDACVELITNCVDAYRKGEFDRCPIEVEIRNPGEIIVRDQAIGLSDQGLQDAFLQVGIMTAAKNSRGFFSRGAKDISAIGNITFSTIRNGYYSECTLTTDVVGTMTIVNQPVTDETRQRLGIINNGLHVSISLLPTFHNVNYNKLFSDIQLQATLRLILSDPQYEIYLIENMRRERIACEFPAGSEILYLEYIVPGYGVPAIFTVNKVAEPIAQPTKESQMQFGILVCDDTSIYECSTIDSRFRWHPYMNYLYGKLYCPALHQMLLDYDENGSTEMNPYPLLDPSRIGGLNKNHPFVSALFTIPKYRIDFILRDLNSQISKQRVTIEDLDNIIDELVKLGVNIVDEKEIHLNWVPSYDQNLVKAIQDHRGRYVQVEKSYALSNSYTVEEQLIRNYLRERITPDENTGYYVGPDAKCIIEIPNWSRDDPYQPLPQYVLSLLPSEEKENFTAQPFIYILGPNGELQKLYTFEKGNLSDAPAYEQLTIQKKSFDIVFINDLNSTQRYVIDMTNGISLNININNPVVAKYLTNEINIATISSLQSLTFMKELIVAALTDIITGADIENGKLILDADSATNNNLLLDYWASQQPKIELSVEKIFEGFMTKAKETHLGNVWQEIEIISQTIATAHPDIVQQSDLQLKVATLIAKVESIMQ